MWINYVSKEFMGNKLSLSIQGLIFSTIEIIYSQERSSID